MFESETFYRHRAHQKIFQLKVFSDVVFAIYRKPSFNTSKMTLIKIMLTLVIQFSAVNILNKSTPLYCCDDDDAT